MSNTPTSNQDEGMDPAPGRALATSTPAPAFTGVSQSTGPKPDVSQLFQKLGDKLGWFQYNNIDAAIHTLSKSAKKKSARPRRDKDRGKLPDDTKDIQSEPKRKLKKTKIRQKHQHECESSEEGKENKKPTGGHMRVRSHSPSGSENVSVSDDEEQGVPVRKSAACTDLTKSWTKQGEKGKLRHKNKNLVSTVESPSTDLPEIKNLRKGHDIRLSSARSSSEGPEYFGEYVTESTRIHSDASLECVLDSADVSAISFHRNDSLSGSRCIDSFQYNLNEDSYKQLNIKGQRSRLNDVSSNSPNTSSTDNNVCLNFQALRIDNSKDFDGKGRNSSKTFDNSDLFTTAIDPCIVEDSLEVDQSPRKCEKGAVETSSGSSYEVEDVSVQVHLVSEVFSYKETSRCKKETLLNHGHKSSSSGSGSSYEVDAVVEEPRVLSGTSPRTEARKHKHLKSKSSSSEKSDNDSFVEVEDVSIQTSFQIPTGTSPQVTTTKYKHLKSGSSSSEKSEDDSFVEVEDVSMQTSFQNHPDPQQSCKAENSYSATDSKSKCFCDVVEDISTHVCEQVESKENGCQSGLEDLNNISLPDLDFELQPQVTFTKRDPSIYFDAKDLSNQPTKLNKRDPSVYFDAKQSLLSSSQSSNSSFELTNSPKDSIKHRPKGDNYIVHSEEIPSGVVSISDTDSDNDHPLEKSPKISKMKKHQCKSFSSDSDNDHPVEKSPKISKMKKHQSKNFSSDSEDDLVSYSQTKNKRVKSQRKCSSSSDSSQEQDVKSLSRKTGGRKCNRNNAGGGKSTSRQKVKYSSYESDSSLPDLGSGDKVSQQLSNKHWRTKQTIEVDSSSDEDALETFFQKMRGSKKKLSSEEEEESEKMSMQEFIVPDSEVSDDEDDVFYMSTSYKSSFHSKDDQKKILPIVFHHSSSEDEDFKTPNVNVKGSVDQEFKTPLSTKKKKPRKLQTPGTDIWGLKEDNCLYPPNTKYSFLKSLTENLPVNKCDPEALRFIKTFKKSKQELTQRLFKIYNETVFENKLPDDLEVIWNCRLLRTAGYCVYKKVATSGGVRSTRIELSTKVCDSAERVRDTLIHELCHAAVWLVNGTTDGHGPYWRYWAKKSNQMHPEIPVIGRCHSYSINTKFTYQCSKCGYRIGRHSKSLDMDRKVCGYCHGRFTLLSNTRQSGSTPVSGSSTPRTPNKFALFVKDNYGDIKKREQSLKHKDIMKILSQEFAKNKISG